MEVGVTRQTEFSPGVWEEELSVLLVIISLHALPCSTSVERCFLGVWGIEERKRTGPRGH